MQRGESAGSTVPAHAARREHSLLLPPLQVLVRLAQRFVAHKEVIDLRVVLRIGLLHGRQVLLILAVCDSESQGAPDTPAAHQGATQRGAVREWGAVRIFLSNVCCSAWLSACISSNCLRSR